MCGRCNATYYGETCCHFKVRVGEHLGISPLTEYVIWLLLEEWQILSTLAFSLIFSEVMAQSTEILLTTL